MTECLTTKKSNCKNCYKCIRKCPVKSIGFSDGQAYIIQEDCVLCGECYTVCPQGAKLIRNEIDKARQVIQSKEKVYVSLAPSIYVYYKGKSLNKIKKAIIKLGVDVVEETAIGATLVKQQYEELIKEKKQEIIISSCCHTVNTLIEKYYGQVIPYLAKVITPMHAHGKIIKDKDKDAKVIFIGPCISKKAEMDQHHGVDCVLTFDELDQWLKEENIEIEDKEEDSLIEEGRARSFPIPGGIFACMDQEMDYEYIAIDGMENCIEVLKDITKGKIKKCFIEMSACSGSCVGGPIMKREDSNLIRDRLIIKEQVKEKDFSVNRLEKGEIYQEFYYENNRQIMPGNKGIEDVLKRMGKTSPEKELNCGSCGYNSCREKAIAVCLGKAELTMCLPYLSDKALSFSDNIINNTPNGIIVLDEKLNIQQINSSAKELINLPKYTDLIGNPVVQILNPVDYIMVLNEGKNVYNHQKYLAEYKRYIEETIIHDREYHILIIIIKDITTEEDIKRSRFDQSKIAIEITDKVIDKQMRIVQEIASLLGETTAETKIALTKLKETLKDE